MNAVLNKATPVLGVERIEPILAFWKKLGLDPVVELPDAHADDGRLAFVIFAGDGFEIMYQTIASLKDDLWKAASVKDAIAQTPQQTTLYLDVSDLDAVERALCEERLIVPRRTTFYGATETGYADPAGNVVIFAQTAALISDAQK